MKKTKISTLSLESLRTDDSGLLVGGFSPASTASTNRLPGDPKNKDCQLTNNCSGANCVMGCGQTS